MSRMHEPSRDPFEFRAGRLGRTELGAGSVVVDDDALTIVAPQTQERSIRLRIGVVEHVSAVERIVTLELRAGTPLVLDVDRPGDLRAAVLDACRTLPELTRALRALGSRRGHRTERDAGPDEQARFFAPLLAARRDGAAAPTPLEAIGAFDGPSLERQFTAIVHLFAVQRHPAAGPARRALEAHLLDIVEPLRDALGALTTVAAEAGRDIDDLRRWRAWSTQLTATFGMADRVWLALDEALGGGGWRLEGDPDVGPRQRGYTPPRSPFRRHRG